MFCNMRRKALRKSVHWCNYSWRIGWNITIHPKTLFSPPKYTVVKSKLRNSWIWTQTQKDAFRDVGILRVRSQKFLRIFKLAGILVKRREWPKVVILKLLFPNSCWQWQHVEGVTANVIVDLSHQEIRRTILEWKMKFD